MWTRYLGARALLWSYLNGIIIQILKPTIYNLKILINELILLREEKIVKPRISIWQSLIKIKRILILFSVDGRYIFDFSMYNDQVSHRTKILDYLTPDRIGTIKERISYLCISMEMPFMGVLHRNTIFAYFDNRRYKIQKT
ncbi:hypothetical protein ACJX0J_024763 [Zea mays]